MVKGLTEIQMELKAPKSSYNSFGKYNYRSVEDILTAVKPLLEKHNCQMHISDTLEHVGDRYYIRALVTITDAEGNFETVCAFAREDEVKKGMDGSQITGTASSYARKYALNGLFLIDDTKDADTDEYRKQYGPIGPTKAKALEAELSAKGVKVEIIYSQYNVAKLADLTEEQHSHIINRLNKTKGLKV